MSTTKLSLIPLIALFAACPLAAQEMPAEGMEKVTFVDHVLPVLKARCGSCHNANDRKGSLSIETFAAVMEGGSSGAVIEPGDASSSYLFKLVNHEDEPKMPPNADKLPENELAVIKKWIELGALENSGSKANIKKKASLAKVEVTGTRPAEVAMPTRFFGESAVSTSTRNAVTALAASPWGPLAAVSGHHQITLYNTQTLQSYGALPFPEGQPQILKFSRTGDLLMAGGGRGGASGKVIVFDVKTGERKIEVGDEYDSVLAADLSPDQTMVALGGPKKMLRVYSTATGELLWEQKKHTDWLTAIEFSPDGVLLASGDRANGLIVWEAHSGNLFYDLLGHKGAITDVSWRLDSNVLASSSEDTTIQLWEMQNGGNIKNWGAHGGGASAVDFTRDGQLVSSGRDAKAALWNVDGAKVREFAGMTDLGMEVAFDAETKRILAGDWSGIVRVWNADDGAELGQLDTNPPTLDSQIALLQSRLPAVQEQVTATAAAAAAIKAQVDARNVQAEQLTQVAQTAQQQLDQSKNQTAAANTLVTTQQEAMQRAAEELMKAEAALAAAKAAFELAQKDVGAVQQAIGLAQAVQTQAQTAEQAAQQAKDAADKAVAEAKPTQDQLNALQAADAASQKSQQDLATLQSMLQQLIAAKDAGAQTAAK